MRSGGGRSRWRLLLFVFLLVSLSTVNAQPIENSPKTSTEWKARYFALLPKLAKLEKAWADYRVASIEVSNSLVDLQRELSALNEEHTQLLNTVPFLRTQLSISQNEAAMLTALSESLQTRLDALPELVSELEQTAQAAIRRAKTTGTLIGVGGLLFGIVIALVF